MRFACGFVLLLLMASPAAGGAPAATRLAVTLRALDGSPREFELQPSFAATRFGWSLRSEALASAGRFGQPFGESAVGIALSAPLARGFSLEGLAIERFSAGEAGTRQGLAGARLINAGSRGRLWAGYANATSARAAPDGGPVFQSGGEVAIGPLSVSASVARSATRWQVTIPGSPTYYAADTLVPPLIPPREETRRSVGNTVRLGTAWDATRWSVETLGGVRWESALPAARWLRVEGAWWFVPRLALRLGLGREVADSWQVSSARRGTTLALEWTRPHWETLAGPAQAPRAVTLRLVNLPGDLRRIEVTAPGAQRIEAMGDFTMWEAVELRRSSAGRFLLELHMAPGVYRVLVRRDGGPWITPANLPGMSDPDLGEAGSLVAE